MVFFECKVRRGVLVTLGAICVMIAVLYVNLWCVSGFNITDPGTFGGLFGFSSAVFAGFAFVGVAFAAYFQHKTFEESKKTQALAQFETTFYNMLNNYSEFMNSAYSNNARSSRAEFDIKYEAFSNKINKGFNWDAPANHSEIKIQEKLTQLGELFKQLLLNEGLGNCYIMAHHILSFIENNAPVFLDDEAKRNYMVMLMSMQTTGEYGGLLFYSWLYKQSDIFKILKKYHYFNSEYPTAKHGKLHQLLISQWARS